MSKSTISPIGSISAAWTLHPSEDKSVIVTEKVLPSRRQIEPRSETGFLSALETQPGIRRIHEFQFMAVSLDSDHEASANRSAELEEFAFPHNHLGTGEYAFRSAQCEGGPIVVMNDRAARTKSHERGGIWPLVCQLNS